MMENLYSTDSHLKLEDIIEFLPDATLAIDSERRVVIWNKAIVEMTGISAEQMIGKGGYAYAVPFYGEALPLLIDLVLQQDEAPVNRYAKFSREGDNLLAEVFCPALYNNTGAWVLVKASALHDNDGNVIGVIESIRDITDRKRSENALRQSEERFKATFEQAAVGIVHATLDGRFMKANRKFCEIVGYSQEELHDMTFMDITYEHDLHSDMTNMTKLLEGSINYFSMEKRYLKKDGDIVWVNLTVSAINQIEGDLTYVMGVVEDVTNRIKAEEMVKASEYSMRRLFEESSDAILILEDNKIINCNKASLELFKYDSKESIIGKSPWNLSPLKQPEGTISKELAIELINSTHKNGYAKFEWFHLRSDNALILVEVMLTSIQLNGKDVLHALCRDIGERKKMEQNLAYLSYHDQLTGLYNRRYYEEELVRLGTEDNLPLSIIMGDVNGLKHINDHYGHHSGDELLKKSAAIIQKACRGYDMVARLGGDEFIILLPKTSEADTKKIIDRIKELSSKEKVEDIEISISFGYTCKNSIEEDMNDLFKIAENHMYRNKASLLKEVRG